MGHPHSSSSSGDNAFTVACVPTGMKIGVLIIPCGVLSAPARAFENLSTDSSSNLKSLSVIFIITASLKGKRPFSILLKTHI
jgi:hypothetical protein